MTHLSPSFWVHTISKCLQTKASCEKLWFCFEMKILPFSGILSEVRSIVEVTKGVTAKDTRSQVLEAVNPSAPVPSPPPLSLSLSLHTGADTQALCLPVEFIDFIVFFILWWNAPMFYHLWCQTNAALMMTSTNNPLFSSNCTTWLIHVHPTWSEETFL